MGKGKGKSKKTKGKNKKVYKQRLLQNKDGNSQECERLGRYPFMAKANRYLDTMKTFWAESTYGNNKYRLQLMSRIFEEFKTQGKIVTTNPKRFKEKEILLYLTWMDKDANKGQGYDPETKSKLVSMLNGLLTWDGNFIIEKMKKRYKGKFEWHVDKDIKSLSYDSIIKIQESSKKINRWRGVVARFISAMYPNTGLRPRELRLAHLEDLDTNEWEIWVRNPKGKGKYGKQRYVRIPVIIRPAVMEYLQQRKSYLQRKGKPDLIPLIPSLRNAKKDYFYTSTGLKCIKQIMEKKSGITFELKDYRSSYCQILKDNDVSIEAISKEMGHSSTAVTEKFYGRIKSVSAHQEIDKGYERMSMNQTPNEPLKRRIKFSDELAGYR